jgi:PPOX class probable F420-dependent enzyme
MRLHLSGESAIFREALMVGQTMSDAMSAGSDPIVTPDGHTRAFIESQRVARMATVDARGQPYVIPVCYAYDGTRIYTAIDEKPKRPGRLLTRVRNIQENGRVALVIDHYDEDWSRLAWVMIRGRSVILNTDDPNHPIAVRLLRERYPQYRSMVLEAAPIIAITPTHISSWGALSVDQSS